MTIVLKYFNTYNRCNYLEALFNYDALLTIEAIGGDSIIVGCSELTVVVVLLVSVLLIFATSWMNIPTNKPALCELLTLRSHKKNEARTPNSIPMSTPDMKSSLSKH